MYRETRLKKKNLLCGDSLDVALNIVLEWTHTAKK